MFQYKVVVNDMFTTDILVYLRDNVGKEYEDWAWKYVSRMESDEDVYLRTRVGFEIQIKDEMKFFYFV